MGAASGGLRVWVHGWPGNQPLAPPWGQGSQEGSPALCFPPRGPAADAVPQLQPDLGQQHPDTFSFYLGRSPGSAGPAGSEQGDFVFSCCWRCASTRRTGASAAASALPPAPVPVPAGPTACPSGTPHHLQSSAGFCSYSAQFCPLKPHRWGHSTPGVLGDFNPCPTLLQDTRDATGTRSCCAGGVVL